MMARADQREILLVDDDEDFRTSLAAALRDDGYQVLEYRAGRELPMLEALAGVRIRCH